MDKYEFKIKAEQMERLVERKDYKMAAKIADGIDWRRVRNVELLLTVSEIYERLERYEDSYEVLNMAYDRAPIGRTIVYKMAEMATRMGDFEEAIELYKEFVKIAPHDLSRYVLKYKIYQAKGAPLSDQIAILEEFKSREYHEKWSYELALLYYQEGMSARCVEECDDLVLWFSEGEYVRRALELKMRIQPLTASQEEKYRNLMRMSGVIEVADEALAKAKEDREAAGLESEDSANTLREDKKEIAAGAEDTREAWMVAEDRDKRGAEERDDIKVRTVNPQERYNTINLQAELAAGLKDLFEEAEAPVKTALPPKAATSFPEANSLRLGQRADGQLTFNEEENVIERQITGQMTIDEILAEWEVKKQQMEAKIARAVEEDRARKEAEAQLKKHAKEAPPQREVPAAEAAWKADPKAAAAEAPDIMDILMQVEEEDFPDIDAEVEDDLPQELDEIEAILLAALEEDQAEAEAKAVKSQQAKAANKPEMAEQPEAPAKAAEDKAKELPEQSEAPQEAQSKGRAAKEAQSKPASRKEEPASSMIQDLERMLVNELKNVSGQHLTEEQEQLFAYFTAVHGMNQQLSQFLEEEESREKDGTSVTGNLVVTGESGTGKTTLAIDLVKAVQKQRRMKGSKMAKVTGEDLSRKDVAEVVRKLNGGALVIERAGGLTTEAAAMLSGAMLGQTGNLFVILEDEPAEIQRLFVRCESLAAKFQKTIEIPVFTNNELVAFGKSYAEEQGYVLDEMAVLALYNRIGNNQTSDHLVNVAEVKEIIDEAMYRASKKGLAKIFAKRRQDEFGNYVLLEKDFED